MSSDADVLLGSQVPRVAHVPDFEWSHADDAAAFAAGYGLTPDPWQFTVLEAWLAERPDGKWAAPRCGLSVPRQNGKNGAIEVRELYGMVALGEKFLHSAHEVKTARKAFRRLVSFFENPRKYPELAAMVVEIRKTNGQEAIVLDNGGSVEFVARSRGSGRGFTVDVLVFDEAQELTDEMLEAMVPAISSAPLRNPQRIFTGTPPGPTANGEVFTRIHDEGNAGTNRRLAWHEWGVVGTPDITDRSVWALANPSLGIRLDFEVVEDELGDLSPEGFLRERLGRWDTKGASRVIDPVAWENTRVDPADAPTDGLVSFAVDMPPDRSSLTISACRRKKGESCHVELVRHELTQTYGLAWAIDWIAERWPDTAAVVIDSYSPAVTLVPELQARKVRVTVTRTGDMVKACGLFFDAVRDGALTHIEQPAVEAALAAAGKRGVGDGGGWVWDRRDPDVDVSPLVSITLAHYGALTTKRNPNRKAKVVTM